MRASPRFVLGALLALFTGLSGQAGATSPATSPDRSSGATVTGSEPATYSGNRRSGELYGLAQNAAFRVALQSEDNLQWISFWVAQGAGYFSDEGLNLQVVVPPMPGAAARFMVMGRADAAILPPPLLFDSIARGEPVVAIANLLHNDPINLVLRGELAEELGISTDMPWEDRVRAMQGLKVGVAPGPQSRLRAMLASADLDPDEHFELVIIDGAAQNEAFGGGRVDALYAHSPYLETALLTQHAVVVLDQAAGEVPRLADRQIYSLVTTRSNVKARADELAAVVRALHRAQLLIHDSPDAAAEALGSTAISFREPQGPETIVRLYGPAVPPTPAVSAQRLARETELLPAHRPAPELSGIDLNEHVDNRFVEQALRGDR
ncbi:MAG: ABC transporter substrate-binding protein [Trueperaceae bacterium]